MCVVKGSVCDGVVEMCEATAMFVFIRAGCVVGSRMRGGLCTGVV